MTEQELNQNQELETETQTQKEENPYEKLSIKELEILLVDAEQIIKATKAQLKENARVEELAEQIKAHRNDPKWETHKEKLDGIKEKVEALKEEKDEINAEIDEGVSEQMAEKSQLEAPYREIIKAHNQAIKKILTTLEEKGRVVQISEEPSNDETSE